MAAMHLNHLGLWMLSLAASTIAQEFNYTCKRCHTEFSPRRGPGLDNYCNLNGKTDWPGEQCQDPAAKRQAPGRCWQSNCEKARAICNRHEDCVGVVADANHATPWGYPLYGCEPRGGSVGYMQGVNSMCLKSVGTCPFAKTGQIIGTGVIALRATASETGASCCSWCKSNTECRAFTYYAKGDKFPTLPSCYLKNNMEDGGPCGKGCMSAHGNPPPRAESEDKDASQMV